MAQKINRNGVVKFQILAAITFAPTVVACKQMWLAYPIVLVISGILFLILSGTYPLIASQKNAFIQTQVVGLVLGFVIFLYPSEKLLWALFWFIFVFFRFLTLWNNKLFEQLSTENYDN